MHHNWQPLLFGSVPPSTLQLNSVTPSVHWVLFIRCCLTSAWEEFTLALLRWCTECCKGLLMDCGSNPEQYYQGGEGERRGPDVLYRRISLELMAVFLRCDRRDSRVRTVLSTCRSGGVRLRKTLPPGQDQVLSLGISDVETLTSTLTPAERVCVCVCVCVAPWKEASLSEWDWCMPIGCQVILGGGTAVSGEISSHQWKTFRLRDPPPQHQTPRNSICPIQMTPSWKSHAVKEYIPVKVLTIWCVGAGFHSPFLCKFLLFWGYSATATECTSYPSH